MDDDSGSEQPKSTAASAKELRHNSTDSIYRFGWLLSLTRKRNPKRNVEDDDGKAGTGMFASDVLSNGHNSSASGSSNGNSNSGSVFYTLRKRIQKKFTSIKVKAYEPDILPCSGALHNNNNSNSSQNQHRIGNDPDSTDFARIVIERHTQNPIRFSSPNANLPVITSRDIVATGASSGQELLPSDMPPSGDNGTADTDDIDQLMERMRIDLLKYGWYWGKLTRSAAQKRLARQDNGTFLVRDSQTEKHQFTVSFRSSGITLHCRIDYKDNYWSFSGLTTPTQCETMIALIEDTMKKSEFGIIGYVKQSSPLTPPFAVRLTKPINRFYEVSSLQHLCRFIIRQRIDPNDIHCLPLPAKLKSYVEENFFDL